MSDMSDNGGIWTPEYKADIQAMMASNAFWEKYGRAPTQEERKQYWYNGCTFEGL